MKRPTEETAAYGVMPVFELIIRAGDTRPIIVRGEDIVQGTALISISPGTAKDMWYTRAVVIAIQGFVDLVWRERSEAEEASGTEEPPF
jgi:hypothetical protein